MAELSAVTANQTPARAPVARRRPSLRAMPYLTRRLGFYLLTAWAAVTLNFAIPRFMPGDPGQTFILQITQQTGQPPPPEMVTAVRTLYGDPTRNLFAQYLSYWNDVTHLRFGLSAGHYPTPVGELIGQALPWTVLLVGVTTLLGWLIGTALGAVMGARPGGRLDSVIAPTTTFLHSLPTFWLALLAAWLFAGRLGWFPSGGGYDPDAPYRIGNVWFVLGVLKYGALPALTLVFIGFNGWLFSMRNVMVTTIGEDYVALARAKGLTRRRVLFGYAARNALLPNVTGLAHAIGGAIGGVVLVEIVFTYPGMGHLLYQAVAAKDYAVMQTVFLMITLAVLIANFIADSIYVLLDPRTREQ